MLKEDGFDSVAYAKSYFRKTRDSGLSNPYFNLYRLQIKKEGFLYLTKPEIKDETLKDFEFLSNKKNKEAADKDVLKAIGIKDLYIASVEEKVQQEGVFKSLEAAKEWAYDHVNNYAFYALKVPEGWLFVADIHH
jgi:hypothetical protein